MVQDQILFYLECLKTDHVADGHCDDIANTEICNWDGGDCCGPNRVVDYCTECQCHETTTPTTAAPTTAAPTTAAPTTAAPITTSPTTAARTTATPITTAPTTAATTTTAPTTAPPSTYTSGTATATTAGGCNTGWIGDNYCDDINNNMECSYDGGDCCGCNVDTQYCTECQCLDSNGSGSGTTCSQPTTGTMTQSTTPVPTTTGSTVPPVPGSFGN